MQNHIAVDIGASSGRLILGKIQNRRLSIREIYRFKNGFSEKEGHFYWDIDYILNEIIKGLQIAKKEGITSCTLGIDTWAVDYVLVDQQGHRLHDVYAYRDNRTDHAIDVVTKKISRKKIYEKTGIQFLNFNTLFQLAVHDPEQLKQANKILLIPDYLYYRLTGKQRNEVTNASTTQLLNLQTRDFDQELLELIPLQRSQFASLVEPGTSLGFIKQDLKERYDLPECKLISVATHDTASAVLGVPAVSEESWAYLSSGTWSLIGIEALKPINNEQALQFNFTNEWGAYQTYRFLKNIMGLWVIQEVQRNYGGKYSFSDFVYMAEREKPFHVFVDFNKDRFLNPPNMIKEIQDYCLETRQPIPQTPGEIARCIFDNLAILYALSLKDIEDITKRSIDVLHIVGGGANNELLNQLTATIANKRVTAGPTESTAIGNLIVQMIHTGEVRNLGEARKMIRKSFDIKEYLPKDLHERGQIIQRFKKISQIF